jgi:hypothetical protein
MPVVRELSSDLIVIYTQNRTWLERLFFGNDFEDHRPQDLFTGTRRSRGQPRFYFIGTTRLVSLDKDTDL